MKLRQVLVAALAAAATLLASSAIADGTDRNLDSKSEFAYPYNAPYF